MSVASQLAAYGAATVSEGTMRRQDTIPAMLDALRELAPEAYQQCVCPGAGFSALPSYAAEDESSDWWASDDACELAESLFELLSEHAPAGTYFGAHPGDGALLGFWPCDDD